MASSLVTTGGPQILISQLSQFRGSNFQPKIARSVASSVITTAQQRVYKENFRDLGHDAFNKVLQEFRICSPRRIRRTSLLTCKLNDNITVSYHPTAACIYIQQRGFRTRTVPRSIGSARHPDDEDRSILSRFFPDFRVKKSSDATGSQSILEKSAAYEEELKKVPESQQKVFTLGYMKGMLSTKSPEVVQKPKRFSKLSTFLTVVSLLILFCFWSGVVRVRFGDKNIGSIIFPSSQEVKPEDITVTFEDVRGMDEAKFEVEEIVSYLRDPERYSKLGGRLPKGVLLVGPPGTGKTLLARAIAGEAQVPFFHASGSEFDEMLVGTGARRVRELFEKAKQRAPSIIFIDEIDSVGSKRVANGIHPYANQTINQLLAEMDGFVRTDDVVVIGATNRVEDLDKALLRPGRFDVRVTVTPPDLVGRKDIFKHYLSKVVPSDDVSLEVLAKGTTGFTGADIENMVNQAALKAAMENCSQIYMRHFEEARDRVLMGPARMRGRLPDEEANRITAYHEAGHTLVGLFTKDSVPLHKVTIIPRGTSLGHTAILPEKDEYHMTRSQMLAQLDVMMGGRVAEELIFGPEKITTGAADDLKKATLLATQMVKTFGMSDTVGLRDFSADDNGNSAFISIKDVSPHMTELIDQEINRILNESYSRAKELLTKHKKEHKALAEALLEHETLSHDEVDELLKTGKVTRRAPKIEEIIKKPTVPRPKTRIVHIHLDQKKSKSTKQS
ncbi:hypothetical protein AB6A40_007755 [Gnathostoma spinigerum]|uniref:AAA+ ATPase domain-containing protein n=1 Tax=Gnathostoma spinigerum TaxID=75299 RepID=A0ABD6EP31_9BILA